MDVILFDIDHTLFDTRKSQELVSNELVHTFHLDREIVDQRTEAYYKTLSKSTDFKPEAYLESMANEFGVVPPDFMNIYQQPALFQQSLFSDVIPLLKSLVGHYQIGVFSEGNADFQRRKLKLSGLDQYLNPDLIFIHARKLEPAAIAALPISIVVDDNPEVVAALNQQSGLQPVWLHRPGRAYAINFKPTHEIITLSELPAWLSSQPRL